MGKNRIRTPLGTHFRGMAPLLILILVSLPAAYLRAEDSKQPVDLLSLDGAVVEISASGTARAENLQDCHDGDPSSAATLFVSSDEPAELIVGFGEKTVTPQRVIVTLQPSDEDHGVPEKLDILVSSVSPHAGFHSVRVDPLEPRDKPQEFSFRPLAAKWIALRFFAPEGSRKFSISELVVIGQPGQPMTHYLFKESPASAFDVLNRLNESSTIMPGITQDEESLFADAKDGNLDDWSFAEAALLASGIDDAGKRKKLIAEIDKLTEKARQEIAKAKSADKKGESLLKFLHQGPFQQGYVSKQTNVSTILEEHTFNCVSSATLYNIVGRKLGLDLRAVEVPEHVFSILYDRQKHFDIETTTEAGFNPARDKQAQEDFTKLTGFAYIPDSNRDERREIGETGLLAITYYNHGVQHTQDKQYQAALMAYFRAMSMDAEFDSAVKNALSALANWSAELSRSEKFEDALRVVEVGVDLAPNDATLLNNQKAVWSEWAQSTMDHGDAKQAIAILKNAAEKIPDGGFPEMQAWLFIRQGEELIKKNEWEQARKVVDRGLEYLEGEPRAEFIRWGDGIIFRRSNSLVKSGDYDQALKLLELELSKDKDSEPVQEQLAWVIQENIEATRDKLGNEPAIAVLKDRLTQFGSLKSVQEVAKSQAYHMVNKLSKDGDFAGAMRSAEKLGNLLADEDYAKTLTRGVIDDQANEFAKQDDLQGAIEVYEKALERFPDDEHLLQNLAATWDRWAGQYVSKKEWEGALDVYEKALNLAPDKDHVAQNIAYCVQEQATQLLTDKDTQSAEEFLAGAMKRFEAIKSIPEVAQGYCQRTADKLAKEGAYDDALSLAERSGVLLQSKTIPEEIASLVYHRWSQKLRDEEKWRESAEVFNKGLEKYPKANRMIEAAEFAWDSWAKQSMAKKDWAAAIEIYEDAIKVLPNSSILKDNLEFCQEKLEKQGS